MKKQIKFAVIIIVVFIIINNLIFIPDNILSWDIFGYYLYLPLKFIYHNLNMHDETVVSSLIAKYHSTATFYQAMKMPNGNSVIVFTMGISIFYFPFFLVGHLMAYVLNYPTDGFSLPYQYSIFAGGIVYAIIGIVVLAKVLHRLFAGKIVIVVLILIVFATNYIVHITMYGQNGMSHNYLFTVYALVIYLTMLWHDTHKLKHAILLAVICGVAILSRPSEVVCLFIPALWGVTNKATAIEKLKTFLKYKIHLIIFTVILLLIGLPQFIYWKKMTGHFFFDSYAETEGFRFIFPFITEVLFSFRKGWLIYTPVMIFAIIGLYFTFKKNRAIFYALFFYFIINLYIDASWINWWHAQSFSQRTLIPSYPIMAVLLGYFLMWLHEQKKILKTLLYALMAACLLLNIFQTWQFNNGIISSDRMTKDYYFAVFGKTYTTDKNKELLLVNRSFESKESFNNEIEYSSYLLKKLDFEKEANRDSTYSYSGKYSFRLDSATIYSPNIEAPYYNLTEKDHAWIRTIVYIYPVKDVESNPFSLVADFNHKGKSYKYKSLDSKDMKLTLNKWNKVTFDYLTPEIRSKSDMLKIYVWLRGKSPVYIDDMQTLVFEKK